jgi:RNA polymerase sigma-32 factor
MSIKVIQKGGRAMARKQIQDELNRYLGEIRRHAILTREEEHALAVAYRAGDAEAGQKLITSNLRLVVKLARDFGRLHPSLLDLIQEGNLGLAMALRKYDPDRGVKFSSYSAWWIRAYILKHLVDSARLVRVGKTEAERKLFFKLRREKEKLERRGFEPTAERVADSLSVPVKAVREMEMRMGRPDLSLEQPVDSHDPDGKSLSDTLASSDPRPDLALEEAEQRQQTHADLLDFGRSLTGRDQVIFFERLLADEPKTLEQVGASFGISRERARQVEKELKDRLKRYLTRDQRPANDVVRPAARLIAA